MRHPVYYTLLCFRKVMSEPTTQKMLWRRGISIIKPTAQRQLKPQNSITRLCFAHVLLFGLQVSFLTWGLLQEKIMTQEYVNDKHDKALFTDSQFLVFVNRILAFVISGIVLLYKRHPRQKCPLYKYSYCSLSNILSSWCQYEALKYVSFPHQVRFLCVKGIKEYTIEQSRFY